MGKIVYPEGAGAMSAFYKGGISVFVHSLFVVSYAISLYWCYETMGEVYEDAMATRQDLEWGDDDLLLDKFEVDIAGGMGGDLFDEPLPSQFLPSFFATFVLMSTAFWHILFVLCAYWSVRFRTLVNYRAAQVLKEGVFVRVIPPKHKGKAEIVPVLRSPIGQFLYFEFQRQRYEIVRGDAGEQVVVPIRCPDNKKLKEYFSSSGGFQEESEITLAREKFGKNSFDIPHPGFWDLYLAQLASPVAVFQFFCSILWLLDEYWKYTMFTLFMILTFEATTAFTRLKNINTLSGMGGKTRSVMVFRRGKWESLSVTDLLPGDVYSLTRESESSETLIPCDSLILRGSAVVNESTLTGESIPQLKDALVIGGKGAEGDEGEVRLSLHGLHRNHVLYSGTLLLQCDEVVGEEKEKGKGKEGTTPDGGVLCYVLRTGFSSAQGELMKMIEFSTQKVSGNMKETALLLSMLVVFALAASGYVFWKGLEDGRRSKYSLLLRCIQIITSVVPANLPMQTGLAVNTALMSLLKAHIYCTEPFRVPLAGRITECLFDKTGTLTTDKLEALGALSANTVFPVLGKNGKEEMPTPVDAEFPLKIVISGCHALVDVAGKLVGDPVDSAALKAINWSYCHANSTAGDVAMKGEKGEEGKGKGAGLSMEGGEVRVTICHRNRFVSQLQRMSTVVIVRREGGRRKGIYDGVYCLVKGSPEAIGERLSEVPSHYWSTYQAMANRGMRVISYALKRVNCSDVNLPESRSKDYAAIAEAVAEGPREFVETNLDFCGFVPFACRVRKDSRACVRSLKESNHTVIMVTGDAPLTAFHVAKQVALADEGQSGLLLTDKLEWEEITEDKESKKFPFVASEIPTLASKYSLVVTGPTFELATQKESGKIWEHISHICVYARMTPEGKERLSKKMKEQKKYVLMCGDGGNDVGALKQAHIGLALLSGFGNANAEKREGEGEGEELSGEDELKKLEAENRAKLQKAVVENKQKAAQNGAKMKEDMKAKQTRYMEEELQKLKEKGETGVMAHFTAMKTAFSRAKAEIVAQQNEKRKDIVEKHGGAVGHSASQISQMMGEVEDGEVPMVKLGDASIAAPFTSKMPSIRSVMDIVRQGRCTLVSTVQQQQILVLNCLIAAYSLSALSLEGSRNSEVQMIAMGSMLVVASMAFTFAKPLDRLSSVRPLPTVFHPASFISLIGQLLLHLGCMIFAVQLAKEAMGEDELKELIHFQRVATKKLAESGDEEGFIDHKPNLLNTVVFLVETAQQVSVMAVNYKGRPWTKSVSENTALLWSLFATVAGVFICSFETFPELNELLGLVAFPNDEIRIQVFLLLVVSTFGTLVWDRLCVLLFARDVFMASWFEAQLDPKAILSGSKYIFLAGLVLGFIVVFDLNIFTLGLLYFAYRQYRKMTDPAAAAPPAAASSSSSSSSSK